MSVHARAPLRIDFAGVWTDAPAFAEREGGRAVTAALSLAVHADFLLGDRRIRLAAEDLDERLTIGSSGWIAYDGQMDLHKAALNMLPVTGGIEIITRSDAPFGSGLGAAGALEVALLAGLSHCRQEAFDAEDLAEYGHHLETSELKWTGGRQDQYSAAFGGFHAFTFSEEGATARRLDVSPEQASDLAAHTVLVFTGRSHFTPDIRTRVWEAYGRGEPAVLEALHAIRELTDPVSEALESGDWEGLGRLAHRHWGYQLQVDGALRSPRAELVEEALETAGAWGWKGTGPGAGGSLVAFVAPERRAAAERAVAEAGGTVLSVAFSDVGVAVWEREDA